MNILAKNYSEIKNRISEENTQEFESEMIVSKIKGGYFTALVNRVGKEDCITFSGESFLSNAEGTAVARAPREKDFILYYEIDFTELDNCPARKHFLIDRRPNIYGTF